MSSKKGCPPVSKQRGARPAVPAPWARRLTLRGFDTHRSPAGQRAQVYSQTCVGFDRASQRVGLALAAGPASCAREPPCSSARVRGDHRGEHLLQNLEPQKASRAMPVARHRPRQQWVCHRSKPQARLAPLLTPPKTSRSGRGVCEERRRPASASPITAFLFSLAAHAVHIQYDSRIPPVHAAWSCGSDGTLGCCLPCLLEAPCPAQLSFRHAVPNRTLANGVGT